MEFWLNDEDIINDMLELSDFCKAPEPAQPPTDFMKKLRGKPSIFDDDVADDELHQEAQYLPVRGHPLLKNGLKKPGCQPMFNQTSALIREVSGFGYGNEMIEHAFRVSNSDDEKDPEKLKSLAFDSTSARKSSKKGGEESDSSTSTCSEHVSYSSISNSSGCVNGPDIYNKTEFPDLK